MLLLLNVNLSNQIEHCRKMLVICRERLSNGLQELNELTNGVLAFLVEVVEVDKPVEDIDEECKARVLFCD